MAKKMTVVLQDDLDGGDATETVSFGIDDRLYEIDLSAKNAKRLRKALEPYLAGGRRVSSARASHARVPKQRAPEEPDGTSAVIRQWARQNGHDVNARGRVPAYLREAFLNSR